MSENATRTKTNNASAKKHAKERAELYELEADVIKALAHPKRLLIVDLLSDGSERTVSDLQNDTAMSQANLSQNLALLRTAGIVAPRRDGNNIYYRLADTRVLKAVSLLRGVVEARAQDKQFLMERAAQKQKDRVKQGAAYALVAMMGAFMILVAAAVTHPIWGGGTMADVPPHVTAMLSSTSFSDMAQTCIQIATKPVSSPPVPSA